IHATAAVGTVSRDAEGIADGVRRDRVGARHRRDERYSGGDRPFDCAAAKHGPSREVAHASVDLRIARGRLQTNREYEVDPSDIRRTPVEDLYTRRRGHTEARVLAQRNLRGYVRSAESSRCEAGSIRHVIVRKTHANLRSWGDAGC